MTTSLTNLDEAVITCVEKVLTQIPERKIYIFQRRSGFRSTLNSSSYHLGQKFGITGTMVDYLYLEVFDAIRDALDARSTNELRGHLLLVDNSDEKMPAVLPGLRRAFIEDRLYWIFLARLVGLSHLHFVKISRVVEKNAARIKNPKFIELLPQLTGLDICRALGEVPRKQDMLVDINGVLSVIKMTTNRMTCPECHARQQKLYILENATLACLTCVQKTGFIFMEEKDKLLLHFRPIQTNKLVGTALENEEKTLAIQLRDAGCNWGFIQKEINTKFCKQLSISDIAKACGERGFNSIPGRGVIGEVKTTPMKVRLGTAKGLAGEVWVGIPNIKLRRDCPCLSLGRLASEYKYNPLVNRKERKKKWLNVQPSP